jgi:hypothetical protein
MASEKLSFIEELKRDGWTDEETEKFRKIVHGFAQIFSDLTPLTEEERQKFREDHPEVVAYAERIAAERKARNA